MTTGIATQGGVNIRQQKWLKFTVSAYVCKRSDKTGTAIGLLYKENRVQVFDSDTNIFRVLEDTKVI